MVEDIVAANLAAKKSCRRWNKNPLSRKANRASYRKMAKSYWSSEAHQKLIAEYKSGDHFINTYPWPYSDNSFADWPESSAKNTYSLISDQSGFVIRHSTSYCAWKIFECNGVWPRRITRERMDAKDWLKFLSEAGYARVIKATEPLQKGHHYVGVDPRYGKFGLVVWLEDFDEGFNGWVVEYSTYLNGCYTYCSSDRNDFTWVQIS